MADLEDVNDELQDMEIQDQAEGTSSSESLQLSKTHSVRNKMLKRISKSDAHFKHQQRGELDLTEKEKYDIASDLLDKNAPTFLLRYGTYLSLKDLDYFKDRTNEYEIDFYVKKLQKEKSKSFSVNRVKNRRYEAMKKLVTEGEYFSYDEMKYRDPLLYEQLVGQFLSSKEIQDQVDKSDLRFSSILLKHMDQLDENKLYYQQKEKEESQMEETDDEDEDDEEEMEEEICTDEEAEDVVDGEPKKKISSSKKHELKEEFLRIMQERFLSGQDADFDYSKVDNNEEYDDLDVLNRDAEEEYFAFEDND